MKSRGFTNLVRAWRTAASDLGIKVTAPITLRDAKRNKIDYAALVHDFGSRKGMAILFHDDRKAMEAADAAGYGFSCMDAYQIYARDSFINALIDWEWTGTLEDAPKWYIEASNSDGENES